MEWLLLIALIALMLLGMPIAYAIILTCVIFLAVTDLAPMVVIPQQVALGLDSFPLLAIPMFIFMGFILEKAQLTQYVISWLTALIGRLPGGMGAVTIIASGMLAALTGSGPATVVAIGVIMIPALIQQANYNRATAAGLVSVAGALGPILPPSIIMILYGATMGVSITDIFIGGIIPGLLMMAALLVWNLFIAGRTNTPNRESQTADVSDRAVVQNAIGNNGAEIESERSIFGLTLRVLPITAIPLVVVGGIYGGFVTPTEAAALGIVASLALAVLYRSMSWKLLKESIGETVTTSAMVCILLAAAGALSWILAKTQLPARIADSLAPMLVNELVFLVVLLLILFVVGTIMESAASVVILAPILAPVGVELGVDPLHLAVVFCMALVVGYVTPPFGLNLFTAVSISKLPYGQVVKGSLQPLLVIIAVTVMVALIPQTVTFLPNLM